jgi:hypothetical protein
MFQNCGTPGFEREADGGLFGITSSQTSTRSRFTQAPFPLEYNLNYFSYMSCPMAGEASKNEPSFLNRPFFSIRAGAYDNMDYAAEFGLPSSLSYFERSARLQAGIRIRPEFVTHLKNQFKRSDAGIKSEVLRDKLTQQSFQPSIALVNIERSRMQGGFGWDYSLISPILVDLSDSRFLSTLSKAPVISTPFEYKRLSHFATLDPANRSIVASMSWGKGESDHRLFARELRNNLMVTAGFSEVGSDNITQLLDGNFSDVDNVNTLAGRGYRLRLSANPAQGGSMTALEARFLIDVEELDLSKKPYQNISVSEGQSWDCFSLMIVRHIDRIDPADSLGRPYCWNQPDGTLCRGKRDGAGPDNTVIDGVRYACPSQTVASLNATVVENGVNVRRNRIRYDMARRVLPAEYFEVNTDPNHMCVVPSDLAFSYGKCYASGDNDPSKFIQYNVIQALPGNTSRPCGQEGGNECPVYVSICYRKQ